MSKKFNELDKNFSKLQREERLNISTIEELMLNDINEYKNELGKHIEELLSKEINEKELISKKNNNGMKKGTN